MDVHYRKNYYEPITMKIINRKNAQKSFVKSLSDSLAAKNL